MMSAVTISVSLQKSRTTAAGVTGGPEATINIQQLYWNHIAYFGSTMGSKGDLYGTTEFGGSGPSACGSLGCGTIFKMSASGKHYTVLHSFVGSDGEQPLAGLFVKGRSFYGTTSSGGTNSCSCGEVFEFAP